MQSLRIFSAALLSAAIAATCASAGEPSRRDVQRGAATAADLSAAVQAVSWTCAAERCVGVGPQRESGLMADCRKAAAALGPLASFQRGDRALSYTEVAACNRSAGAAGYRPARPR